LGVSDEHSKHELKCTRGCLVSQRLAEQVSHHDVDTQGNCKPVADVVGDCIQVTI